LKTEPKFISSIFEFGLLNLPFFAEPLNLFGSIG